MSGSDYVTRPQLTRLNTLIPPHLSYQCLPSHQPKPYQKRPKKRQDPLQAGSLLLLPSSRRRATCTSRRQTLSNSRNCSERLETHFPRKQNVERNAKRRMMQLTPGGMLLKRTREAIPIVRSSNSYPCFPANDHPSRGPSTVTNHYPPHSSWSLPPGCRPRERDCSDLSPRAT